MKRDEQVLVYAISQKFVLLPRADVDGLNGRHSPYEEIPVASYAAELVLWRNTGYGGGRHEFVRIPARVRAERLFLRRWRKVWAYTGPLPGE